MANCPASSRYSDANLSFSVIIIRPSFNSLERREASATSLRAGLLEEVDNEVRYSKVVGDVRILRCLLRSGRGLSEAIQHEPRFEEAGNVAGKRAMETDSLAACSGALVKVVVQLMM